MATNIYGATSLTGGGAGSLDAIDGAELADKDVAIVFIQGDATYDYILDIDSGAAESSPNTIAPDTNAGNKRWILHGKLSGTNTGDQTLTNGGGADFLVVQVFS